MREIHVYPEDATGQRRRSERVLGVGQHVNIFCHSSVTWAQGIVSEVMENEFGITDTREQLIHDLKTHDLVPPPLGEERDEDARLLGHSNEDNVDDEDEDNEASAQMDMDLDQVGS